MKKGLDGIQRSLTIFFTGRKPNSCAWIRRVMAWTNTWVKDVKNTVGVNGPF